MLKKNRDLSLGDVHVISVSNSNSKNDIYVALMIAQNYSSKVVNAPVSLAFLGICLQKVAQFSKQVNASVHLPRLGASTPSFNWYGTERLIRKELCGKGVKTFIYYFKRGVTTSSSIVTSPTRSKNQPSPKPSKYQIQMLEDSDDDLLDINSPPAITKKESFTFDSSDHVPPCSPNEHVDLSITAEEENEILEKYSVSSPLPSFFNGYSFLLNCNDKSIERLIEKHIVAFGGKLCNSQDERVNFVVTSTPLFHTTGTSVLPNYISACVLQQSLLDPQEYKIN